MRGTLLGLLAIVLSASPLACEDKTIVKKVSGPETPAEPSGEEEPGPEEAPPAKPTDPLVVDLGDVQAGVDVPFDVPAGALGFNMVVEGQASEFDQRNPFGIERIADPNG